MVVCRIYFSQKGICLFLTNGKGYWIVLKLTAGCRMKNGKSHITDVTHQLKDERTGT